MLVIDGNQIDHEPFRQAQGPECVDGQEHELATGRVRPSADTITRGESSPFALRILPLELFFDLRIAFPPKGFEIVGDLNRAVIRCQNLNS